MLADLWAWARRRTFARMDAQTISARTILCEQCGNQGYYPGTGFSVAADGAVECRPCLSKGKVAYDVTAISSESPGRDHSGNHL